ncbi:MAG: hypothetical protein HY587_01840 [Candidatus Omnitrophica bacterium]|nr:hypothetical protein [Candidatus Omnitrophota bacterium]
MATIFIYYVMGFSAFLAVTYLCIQLGWLFESEGRVNWGGLAGLSVFLVSVFVFISFVCSLQLSGWTPPHRQAGKGADAEKRFQKIKDLNVAESVKKAKQLLTDSGERIEEAAESVWEDEVHIGFFLAPSQGATAVHMLIQDISEEGFLNRLNPLNLVNFQKQKTEGAEKADTREIAQLPEEEKKRLADQEAFRIRIEAIEKEFNQHLKIPSTVLPDQLRRTEEVYLAVSTGEVKYPYLRFEFAFPRNKALTFLEKFSAKGADQKLSVRIPVVIELFGENFDLGVCTLNFPDAHVEPTLEKAKQMEVAHQLKIRIMPNHRPGQIIAVYEKFKPSEKSGGKPTQPAA